MTAQLTVAQPLASAAVHGLATLLVIDRPPTAWCPTCKGRSSRRMLSEDSLLCGAVNSDRLAVHRFCHNPRSDRPDGLCYAHACPVCDSSLGVKAGDRLTIVSSAEPPTYGDSLGNGWEIGRRESDQSLWLVHLHDKLPVVDRSISLPLGVPVGSVVVTDCLPIVGVDASPPGLGEYIRVGGRRKLLRTRCYDHERCENIAEVAAELAWQSFTAGKWAFVVTEPEAT